METIPGFLDMTNYLRAFDATLGRSETSEREAAAQWIARVKNRAWPESLLQVNAVIHGDCKINNLLFDQQGERVLSHDGQQYDGSLGWTCDLVRSVSFSRGFHKLDYQACIEGFLGGADKPIHELLAEHLRLRLRSSRLCWGCDF